MSPSPASKSVETARKAADGHDAAQTRQSEGCRRGSVQARKEARSPGGRAPRAAAGEGTVSIKLDSAILEHFQKDGPGWQDRINDALRAVVEAESSE